MKNLLPFPIEDNNNLDKRSEIMDLGSIGGYLSNFLLQNSFGLEPITIIEHSKIIIV